MESIIKMFHITPPKDVILNKDIHKVFRLPISYVEHDKLFDLNSTVANDLELTKPPIEDISGSLIASNTMYEHLLNPQNQFASALVPEWSKHFTTDIDFLKQTQQILKNVDYISNENNDYVDYDKFSKLWKDLKQDNHNFMDKYSFIEFDIARHLNESSTFLQALSFVNMASPALSFFIPIIFLIFPFIILKIQGIPIDLTTYFNTLKNIAKNHFIGSIIKNVQNISWTSLFYLSMTIGLYGLQIYQNYMACIRFYNNISRINRHISFLKDYILVSTLNIDKFVELNSQYSMYKDFCTMSSFHSSKLKDIYNDIKDIEPFEPKLSKISEIGYLLRCFYHLHTNPEYENSLRYSAGFNGFIFNLRGVRENMISKNINCATFNNTTTTIEGLYYPALVQDKHVKNNCSFDKNIIITGPNASGKTTLLKSASINIILSQQFGVGFYDQCSINPYTHIHSYLNIPDTSARDSLFQAESRRCKDIIDVIDGCDDTNRHLCIFDELYSGTNPDEATKAAYAFLKYLSVKPNVDFALTTHYHKLCKKIKKDPNMKNFKMDIKMNDGRIEEYTFKLKKGVSNVKGGLSILEEMKYPTAILSCFYKQNGKKDTNKIIHDE
jgi:energy-coupling factor transporter ATP-binding protein EcfA2